MLIVLFSWAVIGGAALLFGKVITDGLYKNCQEKMRSPDIYIMTGLIFLNVFAQFFSLFYKVAGIACTILGSAGVVIVAACAWRWYGRGEKQPLFPGISGEKPAWWRWAAFAFCFLFTLLWDIREPMQYDTGLYHSQAIRWIEEYAVVPGLGNLHMRLAYNSAFMCLQALFSLEWLVGQSLHTLNGFFCLAILAYVCFTVRLWGDESCRVSDLLKCMMAVFAVQKRYDISSSGTDIWPMLLIFYILAKWSELAENGERDGILYGYFCLVGVYAVTVKLSAAPVVALTVYPLCVLLKEKKFRALSAHVAGGFIILLPWLIRNVILSGFLVYPIGKLDLFDPDWKMDKAVLAQDSLDIKMYGRGIRNPAEYNASLIGWIPRWFLECGAGERILILFGAVCIPIALYLLWRNLKERCYPEAALFGVTVLNIGFWMFSAPLMRYGEAYIYMLAAVTLGMMQMHRLKRFLFAAAGGLLLVFLGLYAVTLPKGLQQPDRYLVMQPPYLVWKATQYPIGNQHIWMPDGGDLAGYITFPATPNEWQFRVLKLRGDDFQEGFSHE